MVSTKLLILLPLSVLSVAATYTTTGGKLCTKDSNNCYDFPSSKTFASLNDVVSFTGKKADTIKGPEYTLSKVQLKNNKSGKSDTIPSFIGSKGEVEAAVTYTGADLN